MKVGFTGTREELTPQQAERLGYFLASLEGVITEVHHGDCVGADALFHEWCSDHNFQIRIHPPEDEKYRAWCNSEFSTLDSPRPYLERNRVIVGESDLLIACPKYAHEELRSGTWSTIRYAREKRVPTLIIYP